MNARQFLELLLPSTGVIFTASPDSFGWSNVSHTAIDSAVQHINTLTFDNKAAYFALATYEKARYWDAAHKNADGTLGKWRTRTQVNAQFIRSFFLDLDVDPTDEQKFGSKAEALSELRDFVRKIGLPRPMLVDSGGGIHAYWPLTREVSTTDWRPIADQFKNICLHERFRADRSLTSDQARVLRVLGGFNIRRNAPVKLLAPAGAPIAFDDFARRISQYSVQNGVGMTVTVNGSPIAGAQAGTWGGDDNLGTTNDPLHFDRIVFACAQMQQQVAKRGDGVGEQLWRAGLGIVKFCEPIEPAWRAISDGHAEFSEDATKLKLDNWRAGPTACTHFHQHNPSVCEACPHWTHITSPAQLGRQVVEAASPVVTVVDPAGVTVTVTLPDPPSGYKRRKDGAVVFETEDSQGAPIQTLVCPYDLYPLSIGRQNGTDASIDEYSQWRVHLPMEAGKPPQACDFPVPLGLLADQRSLSKLLYSQGIILTSDQPKYTHSYMSVYLQQLARTAGRDKMYERLGWHDEHTTFVLGDRALFRDGTHAPYTPSQSIRQTTKDSLKPTGTLDGWKAAMQFYNRPGYEGHRFFIYAALGAPLFHMNGTGNKGMMLAASGASGRGKTTCLRACSSLWGGTDALIMNGNKDGSTINALYSAIGTTHSLPFLWDDMTERDPDELRQFLLNISQGEGKRRLTRGSQQSTHIDRWETLVLSTTNADDISRLTAGGRDVDPHLMRLISVEFATIDNGAEAKIKADTFLREISLNHGHAGPAMMAAVVKHYDAIQKGYIANIAKIDRLLGSSNASAERYWSAAAAAAYTGAQIAKSLGLIPFDPEADLPWIISLLTKQRDTIREASASPTETLVEYLNNHLRNTLIVSAKAASNLDNVVHKPFDALEIRHEADTATIYVARGAIKAHCAKVGLSMKKLESDLVQVAVIMDANAKKVLGADTSLANGQVRCWKVDATKLGGLAIPQPQPGATASNVIPIGGKAA